MSGAARGRGGGRRTFGAGACALAAALLLAACGSGVTAPPSPSSRGRTTEASSGGLPSPAPSASATCVDRVLASMSEEQRIGQLFSFGLPGDRLTPPEAAAVRTYHFGSVWFASSTSVGVAGIRAVSDQVQALVGSRSTADVRFFVAANQEGGEIQALRGPGFSTIPSALDQGTRDPTALERQATQWGRELLTAGVNLDLAPVMDVVPTADEATNAPIGQLHREYGHDPATVTEHGLAFIRGMRSAGVATTAKHFPGLGRVVGNTDFTAGVVDRVTTATDPFLQPFAAAVSAGVPFVMVSLATYTRIDPDRLAVFSPAVMGLLRERMGFGGVIVSDELGDAAAVASIPPATRAIDFLSAGGDMIVSKSLSPAVAMYGAIRAKASTDASFGALVDAAVTKVLTAKDAAHLLPCSAAG